MTVPYLNATHMTGGYGGADILHNCALSVEKGEIAVIVGPNGAGKSTAMKAVFGMLTLREGSVVFDGEDITSMAPQEPRRDASPITMLRCLLAKGSKSV